MAHVRSYLSHGTFSQCIIYIARFCRIVHVYLRARAHRYLQRHLRLGFKRSYKCSLRGLSDVENLRPRGFSPKFAIAVDDDDDTVVDNVIVRTFAICTYVKRGRGNVWRTISDRRQFSARLDDVAMAFNGESRRVSGIYFRGLMQTGCASLLSD